MVRPHIALRDDDRRIRLSSQVAEAGSCNGCDPKYASPHRECDRGGMRSTIWACGCKDSVAFVFKEFGQPPTIHSTALGIRVAKCSTGSVVAVSLDLNQRTDLFIHRPTSFRGPTRPAIAVLPSILGGQ